MEFKWIYTQASRDTGDMTPGQITANKYKVNQALRDICSEMNYSWLQRAVTFPFTPNQQSYPINTTVNTIIGPATDWDEDTPLKIWYRDADNKRCNLENFSDSEWETEEDIFTGDPYGFNVNCKAAGIWQIYLALVPDTAFVSQFPTANLEYQALPTALVEDTDIPVLPSMHHQGLLYWTSGLICTEMGDTESAKNWFDLAGHSLGLMKKKQVQRLGRPKRVYPRAYLGGRAGRTGARDYN